jgi:hypothetical protein
VLFHKDIFLPDQIKKLRAVTVAPRVTGHAREAAQSDRYGQIIVPNKITFCGQDVIEAEMAGGAVIKLVIRLKYNAASDAIYVLGFENGAFLKTVWLNAVGDKHVTLDKAAYNKYL